MKECYHTAPMHLRCQLQPSSINACSYWVEIPFCRSFSNSYVHLRLLHIGKIFDEEQLYFKKDLAKTTSIILNDNKRYVLLICCDKFSLIHSNLFDRLASCQNLLQLKNLTCTILGREDLANKHYHMEKHVSNDLTNSLFKKKSGLI